MKASEIVQPRVITADALAPAKQVAAHMIVGRISGFPITDREQKLVGIVTELDLIRVLRLGRGLGDVLADEIMTRDVITVDVDDDVAFAGCGCFDVVELEVLRWSVGGTLHCFHKFNPSH